MELAKLQTLSTPQLQALNSAIIDVLLTRSTNESLEKARQFKVGQIVQFKDKQGKIRKIEIERINTKSVSGKEVGGYTTWRVHPSFLSAV